MHALPSSLLQFCVVLWSEQDTIDHCLHLLRSGCAPSASVGAATARAFAQQGLPIVLCGGVACAGLGEAVAVSTAREVHAGSAVWVRERSDAGVYAAEWSRVDTAKVLELRQSLDFID